MITMEDGRRGLKEVACVQAGVPVKIEAVTMEMVVAGLNNRIQDGAGITGRTPD